MNILYRKYFRIIIIKIWVYTACAIKIISFCFWYESGNICCFIIRSFMRRRSIEEVIKILAEHEYKYIDGEYKNPHSKLICETKDGYKVIGSLDKLMNRGHNFPIIHKSNPYSIYNIKKMVHNFTFGEFDCISDEYDGNNKDLLFRHNICGRTFSNKWINISRGRYKNNVGENKTGLFCPHCQTKQLESMHALILKQVWIHEEPDTIVEDGSCYNPNTGHQLPTDIVNHRLKIAIEIQSWFHDKKKQKEKDMIKKQFWINNGYHFYAIDHRDYSVIEMIQLFFPYIDTIPSYIDYDYSNKFDTVTAQKLLDEYKSVNKVAKMMDCNPHKIYDSIYHGLMHYPDDYIKDCYTPIVQLDLNQKFIYAFNTIQDASNATGINPCNISACLRDGRNYAGGYYWLYKGDFDSGDYIIVEHRGSRLLKSINQYNLDGNFIKHFDTIKQAGVETNTNVSDIYRTAIGERNHANNYIWKFDNPDIINKYIK